jgi:pimeloyl-ACP methyl ester carboxylesterase
MEAEVRRAGPSGVDPMPAIRALRIPAYWLYGGKDRTVPSRLCIERLDPVAREPGRDFTYRSFPGGNHGLILTANGLQAEAQRSSRFVEGLYPSLREWLAARGFTGFLATS